MIRNAPLAVRRSVFMLAASFPALAVQPSRSASTRLTLLPREALNDTQRAMYDRIVESRTSAGIPASKILDEGGALRGPWNAQVTAPAIGVHLEQMATAVRAENSLPPRLYELGILVVGASWRSQFEWFAHEPIARKAGITDAALEKIKELRPPSELEPHLQPDEFAVYQFCRELSESKRASDSTFSALRAHLTEPQVADLVFSMGCYHAVSLTLNVFEVALPEGASPPFDEAGAGKAKSEL